MSKLGFDIENKDHQPIKSEPIVHSEELLAVTTKLDSTEVTSTITISKSENTDLSGPEITVESSLQVKNRSVTKTVTTEKTNHSRLEQVIQHKFYQHVLFKEKIFLVFPLDIELRQKVDVDRCIATTSAQKRCTRMASAVNLDSNIEACLENLMVKQHRTEYHLLKRVLRRMEEPILCKIHHRFVAKHIPSCVEKLIYTYKTENEGLVEHVRQAFHYWASEIMEPGRASRTKHNTAQVTGEIIEKSIKSEQIDELATQILKRALTGEKWELLISRYQHLHKTFGLPLWVQRMPKKRRTTFEDRMKQAITKPFDDKDVRESGYLYVFTFDMPGFSGRYKIGISKEPFRRVENEWTSHYQNEPRIVFNELEKHVSAGNEKRPILHYKRLEKLVHSELDEYGYKQICHTSCEHREWFEADEDHVVAVAQKWCTWMRQDPYKFGRPWELRDEILNDKDVMKTLCTPVGLQQDDEKVQGSPV